MKIQEESLFIGKYDATFIFKAEGRLTQKSLWNANTAVQKCMDDSSVMNVLVDITQCSYMDSTILGINRIGRQPVGKHFPAHESDDVISRG